MIDYFNLFIEKLCDEFVEALNESFKEEDVIEVYEVKKEMPSDEQ